MSRLLFNLGSGSQALPQFPLHTLPFSLAVSSRKELLNVPPLPWQQQRCCLDHTLIIQDAEMGLGQSWGHMEFFGRQGPQGSISLKARGPGLESTES